MAKRRGNNEGSIYRRKDGYWVGQYGVQTAQGIKTRYIYGKDREEVREVTSASRTMRGETSLSWHWRYTTRSGCR